MNKVIIAIFIMIMLFLVACTSILDLQDQRLGNEKNSKKAYNDGIYTEEGEIWKNGNENATVVISSGRITSITLRKLDNIGKEVDYEKWSSESTNGNPNLKKYRKDLSQEMLDKQTYDVNTISGATISSENWIRAVRKALDKASK